MLSSSTAPRDYHEKWLLYQQMPSLTDYLIIAQTRQRVEHFTRQKENLWLYSAHTTPDAEITLTSLNSTLKLSEIYERISFDENS